MKFLLDMSDQLKGFINFYMIERRINAIEGKI